MPVKAVQTGPLIKAPLADNGRLAGCTILVAEDEYVLADEISTALRTEGAQVLGPFPDAQVALDAARTHAFDGAVVDFNLRGQLATQLAEALIARSVGLVMTTGYDAPALPPHLRQIPRCLKPCEPEQVLDLLLGEIDSPCAS